MKKQTILLTSLIVTSLLIAGCGTSPKSNIYILNTIDRDASESSKTHNIVVKVGPISIPDTLDQAQIVTRKGSNTINVDEFNRWSGDYQSDIRRVLGENISILLPTDQITLGQEVVLLPIDYQVIVNIREFDGELGGLVILNADWTVAGKRKDKKVVSQKSVLKEQSKGPDYKSYVAAQSRLLAKLSEQISNQIRAQLK
jgi:uncharacterized lipoprotein YmbA